MTKHTPDPRGIIRRVVAADFQPDGCRVTYDCGHVGRNAPHFSAPKIGTEKFCYECGVEARAVLAKVEGE